MIYPAQFRPEPGGGYTVTFPDLPGATFGNSREDAQTMAADALASALSFYAEDAKPFPEASAPRPGERLIFVPALVQAKLALIRRMAELGLSNVDLAAKLGVDEKSVRRLVSLNHESRMSKVEAALDRLGQRLEVVVGGTASTS